MPPFPGPRTSFDKFLLVTRLLRSWSMARIKQQLLSNFATKTAVRPNRRTQNLLQKKKTGTYLLYHALSLFPMAKKKKKLQQVVNT